MRVRRAGVRGRNMLPTAKCNFIIGFKIVNMMNRKIVGAELLRSSHSNCTFRNSQKNIAIEYDGNLELCVTVKSSQ